MVHSRSLSCLGLAVILLGLSACTAPIQNGSSTAAPAAAADGDSAGSGDGTPTAPVAPSGSTCSGVVECTRACADGDDACVDTCIAEGSASAKQKYEALSICLRGTVCNGDVACMEQQCKYHIDAC